MTDADRSRLGGWAERPEAAAEPLDYVTQVGVAADGSPIELHFVFTDDGLYVPAIVRRPEGAGPFPTVVCLHDGSGGLVGAAPYRGDGPQRRLRRNSIDVRPRRNPAGDPRRGRHLPRRTRPRPVITERVRSRDPTTASDPHPN